MYTLRTFKKRGEVNRKQQALGDGYWIVGSPKVPTPEEGTPPSEHVLYLVFGENDSIPGEGIPIYKDDYAFIMTETGKTFECLNRGMDK